MFCQKCGVENIDEANFCRACGTAMREIPSPWAKSSDEDPAMRFLLPVGRSPYAIAAGYLGLFSVLLVFAPFALICGIIALREIKKNPKQFGKGRAIFGLVMGSLGTLGLLAVGVLFVINR